MGLFSDFNVVATLIPIEPAEQTEPENNARYEKLYPLFQRTYTALKPLFDELAI